MNRSWRVSTDTGDYLLKLFLDVRGPQLAFQFRVLRSLAAAGVPVVLPVPSVHGTDTLLVGGHEFGVFPWLNGRHRSGLSMSMERSRDLGRVLGSMHVTLHRAVPTPRAPFHQPSVPAPEALARVDRLLDLVDSRHGGGSFDALAERTLRMKRGMLAQLAHRRPPDIPVMASGYLHGDLHPHNVLLDDTDRVLAILDWDRLRVGPYSKELVRAAAFFFTYGDERGIDLDRAAAFVTGYREIFDLGAHEIGIALHRLWWERLCDNWVIEWHYMRRNQACDHLLPGQTALVKWWTAHFDEILKTLAPALSPGPGTARRGRLDGMAELPLVRLTGSPLDRGRQHGEALRDRVADNVALYTERMRHDAGLSADDIAERADRYLAVFTAADPDYRETMVGIAEGSGRSLRDIAMLNARFELLYSAWSAAGSPHSADECTGFGATRARTVDGAQRIGQNWDWFPGVRGGLLAWRDAELSVLAYTEAGIAGAKIGVNSAGIGLCVNGLSSQADDWRRDGLPFHLRTGRILRSRSLTEAVAHASVDAPSCSANFLIGSAADGVTDVESSPLGSRRLVADDDAVLVHANHFVDPDALGVVERHRTVPITTFSRAERLSALLNATPTVSTEDIAAALRDHEGGQLAVCRHPDPAKPEHLRTHTAFSAIIDLDAGSLSYTDGPPCESGFTTVELSEVAG